MLINRSLKNSAGIGVMLALGLVLSSCAAPNSTTGSSTDSAADHGSDHGAGHGAGHDMGDGSDSGAMHMMSITDKTSFALAMIPHHQQAIEMAELAKINTTNAKLLKLAEHITTDQTAEITKMKTWLNGQEIDLGMMMQGMLTAAQLSDLSKATGQKFDQLFSKYMIMHHEGAVLMAKDTLTLGDAELAAFGESIISHQSDEIVELRAIGEM